MKTRKTIAMLLAATLGLVFALGVPARRAAADSVTFANGDMAVLDQGGSGKHLYHVKADGSAKTLMGTYGGSNLWDVAFTSAGQLVVAYDTTMYRVDPGSFTPSSPGTVLTISGMAPVNVGFDGVEVGSTGTIYIDAYNNGQNGYFRLTGTGGDNYAATRVGPASGIGWNWHLAVETDAPGAAELLGFSGSTSNMYRFSEAGGTQTKLNNTAIVNPAYSIAYDPTANVAYAGSYSSSLISKVDLATGTTTQGWINMGSAVRGMDFSGGMLYAVKTVANGGIFTIDPATAVATQVGSVTFDSPRGIAVFGGGSPEGDIPEPASAVLVFLGLGAVASRLRRRLRVG